MSLIIRNILLTTLTTLFFLFFFSTLALAIDGPYVNGSITQPILTEPMLGMGSGHGPLANGIQTIFWNPAGLARIDASQGNLIYASPGISLPVNKSYNLDDEIFSFDDGSQNNFKGSASFTSDYSDVTDPFGTAKQRQINARGTSQTYMQNITVQEAFKVNDYFVLGVTAQSPVATALDINGDFPAVTTFKTNLRDVNDFQGTGITIDTSGKLTYSYDPGGAPPYSYSTSGSLWSGFLDQTTQLPVNINLECKNNVEVENGVTISGAGEYNNIFYGLNIIPISANVQVDNFAYAAVAADADTPYFYSPDFNPDDESDVAGWILDPDKYGTESGYQKKAMNFTAGEIAAEGRYRGFFTGSALRMDLGFQYDVNDAITFSLVAENFSGSNLELKGSGISTYAYHKISTEGAESLFDPSQRNSEWTPISDNPQEIDGAEDLYLAPDTTITIPKKLSIGMAFKKPFILSINYEQFQSPINFRTADDSGNYKDVSISGINVLRLGTEMQLLILPIWGRFGTALMMKPTSSDLDIQQSIDDVFANSPIGMLPTELDIGLLTRIHKVEVGVGFGANAFGLLPVIQADALNQDLGQLVHYGIYTKYDNWTFNYQALPDFPATLSTYGDKRATDPNAEFAFGDIKWLSVMSISYLF